MQCKGRALLWLSVGVLLVVVVVSVQRRGRALLWLSIICLWIESVVLVVSVHSCRCSNISCWVVIVVIFFIALCPAACRGLGRYERWRNCFRGVTFGVCLWWHLCTLASPLLSTSASSKSPTSAAASSVRRRSFTVPPVAGALSGNRI